MRLVDLEPHFLSRIDDTHFRDVDRFKNADGIRFLCPKCLAANNGKSPGVHSIICWRPRVPQTTHPIPGRWEFEGTSYSDLTLKAGSSSILLTGEGCKAHFFIRGGEIIGA